MAVLVTRPDERGKALVDQLNQAGVVALHLPCFLLRQVLSWHNYQRNLIS